MSSAFKYDTHAWNSSSGTSSPTSNISEATSSQSPNSQNLPSGLLDSSNCSEPRNHDPVFAGPDIGNFSSGVYAQQRDYQLYSDTAQHANNDRRYSAVSSNSLSPPSDHTPFNDCIAPPNQQNSSTNSSPISNSTMFGGSITSSITPVSQNGASRPPGLMAPESSTSLNSNVSNMASSSNFPSALNTDFQNRGPSVSSIWNSDRSPSPTSSASFTSSTTLNNDVFTRENTIARLRESSRTPLSNSIFPDAPQRTYSGFALEQPNAFTTNSNTSIPRNYNSIFSSSSTALPIVANPQPERATTPLGRPSSGFRRSSAVDFGPNVFPNRNPLYSASVSTTNLLDTNRSDRGLRSYWDSNGRQGGGGSTLLGQSFGHDPIQRASSVNITSSGRSIFESSQIWNNSSSMSGSLWEPSASGFNANLSSNRQNGNSINNSLLFQSQHDANAAQLSLSDSFYNNALQQGMSNSPSVSALNLANGYQNGMSDESVFYQQMADMSISSSTSNLRQQLAQQQLRQQEQQISNGYMNRPFIATNVMSTDVIAPTPIVAEPRSESPQPSLGSISRKQTPFQSNPRSPFLIAFKIDKNNPLTFERMAGHVVEFSKDQIGSRLIQEMIETATPEDLENLFQELNQNSLQLMTDVFGNYIIQKYFEHGSEKQKSSLVAQMKGHVVPLSLQMYGCRVVQKAIDHIQEPEQALIIKELDGSVLDCVRDQNGNHVIQKAIERIPSQYIGFIVKAFNTHVFNLATHPYGCRVLQRILEHCVPEARNIILDEFHENIYHFIEDQYGNYVVQHVIACGRPVDREKVLECVKENLLAFSRHKFASNVVEKCIVHGSYNQRNEIIEVMLKPSSANVMPACFMMNDQFGNYVIQKLLSVVKGSQYERVAKALRPYLNESTKSGGSKHLAAIEKLLNKSNF